MQITPPAGQPEFSIRAECVCPIILVLIRVIVEVFKRQVIVEILRFWLFQRFTILRVVSSFRVNDVVWKANVFVSND